VNLSKEFNELELVRKQLEDEIENDQKLMSKLEQEQNELVAMYSENKDYKEEMQKQNEDRKVEKD